MRHVTHGFEVSEQVPDTLPTLHVGRVQQDTSLPAGWQPLAPLEVVVETPSWSWQSATHWHVPELPLPSMHGKPMPAPGDDVGATPTGNRHGGD